MSSLGLPAEDYGWFIDPHKPHLVNYMAAFIRHAHIVVAVSPGQLHDFLATDGKGGAEGLRHIFRQLAREGRLFALMNGIFLHERQKRLFGMSIFDVRTETDKQEFLRRAAQKHSEAKRIVATQHPEFWPALDGRSDFIDDNTFLVTLISRLVEQKGIQYVEPFVRRVITSGMYPKAAFVFAGAGDPSFMAALRRLTRDFPGRVGYNNAFVSDKDPSNIYYDLYAAGDVFLSLSTFEPFGIAPVEALAAGVAVIASDKQGHKSTVRSIFIPEFEAFGIEEDEAHCNGTRFPIDEYSFERTVDNIMLVFDALYRRWEGRRENEGWQRLQEHALFTDFSWGVSLKPRRRYLSMHWARKKSGHFLRRLPG